jgi:hypothetical protein
MNQKRKLQLDETNCGPLQDYSGPAYIHHGRIYKSKEHYDMMIQHRLAMVHPPLKKKKGRLYQKKKKKNGWPSI